MDGLYNNPKRAKTQSRPLTMALGANHVDTEASKVGNLPLSAKGTGYHLPTSFIHIILILIHHCTFIISISVNHSQRLKQPVLAL